MAFLATVGGWLKDAVRVVRRVADEVDEWLNGPSISEQYDDLRRKFPEPAAPERSRTSSSPDFLSAIEAQKVHSHLGQLDARLGDLGKQIENHQQSQTLTNKTLVLQTDIMKLSLGAAAFDRYTNNIRLHASNLSIHLQNIRNIKGLTDDVNALRGGLYRAMGTINHMANIINSQGIGHVKKIEGIDIEIKENAISIVASYGAFEKTRSLLAEEILAISSLSQEHLEDVRTVQEKAAEVGAFGQQIADFLETRVVPKLMQAKKMGAALKRELDALPVIPKNDQVTGEEES